MLKQIAQSRLDMRLDWRAMGSRIGRGGLAAAALTLLAVAGCYGAPQHQADVPVSSTGAAPLPGAQTDGEGQRLVVRAAACWMGGLWADALAETPADRVRTIERRCDGLLEQLYGTVNRMQYEQIRAIDPRVVDDLATRVRAVARNDRTDAPHAEQLVRVLRSLADAQRENIIARNAADDVKADEEQHPSSPAERAVDKTLAAQALQRTEGIRALLALDAGDLSNEARALGLLSALDRLEIARRLPKHLKVLAVGGPFARAFGVPPPALPEDPTRPIKTGTWPAYLADVAATAGHPVPPLATDAIDRESLAWGGVLEAFADRLRSAASAVSSRTPLPMVLGRVAARLDQEHRTLRALFEAEQAQAGQARGSQPRGGR
jgi:hypothetical protein